MIILKTEDVIYEHELEGIEEQCIKPNLNPIRGGSKKFYVTEIKLKKYRLATQQD